TQPYPDRGARPAVRSTGDAGPERGLEPAALPMRPRAGKRRPSRIDVVRDEHVAAGEADHKLHLCRVTRRVVLSSDQPTTGRVATPLILGHRRCGAQPGERDTASGDPCTHQDLTSAQCPFTHVSLPTVRP